MTKKPKILDIDSTAPVNVPGPMPTEHRPDSAADCDASDVEQMFDLVLSSLEDGTSFHAVITNIYDWWEQKGFLTERQYEVLERAYLKELTQGRI